MESTAKRESACLWLNRVQILDSAFIIIIIMISHNSSVFTATNNWWVVTSHYYKVDFLPNKHSQEINLEKV